jgi:hypothetical protein
VNQVLRYHNADTRGKGFLTVTLHSLNLSTVGPQTEAVLNSAISPIELMTTIAASHHWRPRLSFASVMLPPVLKVA